MTTAKSKATASPASHSFPFIMRITGRATIVHNVSAIGSMKHAGAEPADDFSGGFEAAAAQL